MKKYLILLCIIFSFLSNYAQCLSGNYTIGGATPDYATFTSAVSALTTNGVCGAVVFNIRSGTYNEQISIPQITGSSSTNTITFQSESNDSSSVILSKNSTTALNYIVQLNGVDYITFKKITIKSLNVSAGRVVYILNNSNNNTFQNNIIEGAVTGSSSNNLCLFYSPSAYNNNNNIFDGNRMLNGSYGFLYEGVSSSSTAIGTVISRNFFQNQAYRAISLNSQNAPLVFENTITTNSASTSFDGIYIVFCTNSCRVTKNKLSQGSITFNQCAGSSVNRSLVANNVITSSTGSCLNFNYSNYIDALYNSTNLLAGSTSAAAYLYTASGIVLRNNILCNTFGSLAISSYSSSFVSDYNNLYTTGTTLVKSGTITYATINDWNNATGQDANSQNLNPQYISTTDLHVHDASFNGTALSTTLVTDDVDGVIRNAAFPDIGAYEFTPFATDAALVSFTGINHPCAGLLAVTVKFKNAGMDTLFNINIEWQLNGVTQTTYNWTGVLKSADTAIVSLGSINLVDGVNYNLKAWVGNPNGISDMASDNDTIVKLNLKSAMAGTYTIGGASPNFATFNAAVTDLISRGICGPTTFNARNGTYYDQLTIPLIYGSSSVNKITFQSQSGINTDVTIHNNVLNNTYTIYLNGSDYIEFKNLTITGSKGNNNNLIIVENGSDHNLFYNNRILGYNPLTSHCIISGSTGGANNNYNWYLNNNFIGGLLGIKLIGGTFQKGNIISNNTFTDQSTRILELLNQDSLEISFNNFNNTASSSLNSITLSTYKYISFVKNKASVMNTFLSISGFTGLGSAGIVANNFIHCFGTGIATALSIDRPNVYNNSINISNTNVASVGASLLAMSNFKNNNVVNSGGGIALTVPSTYTAGISNNNNLYTSGAILAKKNTTSYSDLSAWKIATALDSNSISFDPLFVSTTDLHIMNNALANKGASVSGIISDDIDGELRIISAPTIGADEILSSAKDILTYSFNGLTPTVVGVINGTNISLVVPFGTNVTALVATFTHSSGSTVKIGSTTQASGTTPNNFTNQVSYIVTAQDLTTKTYIVTVTFAPKLWYEQTSGVTKDLFSVHFINANSGWTVGANGTILHTTDGGAFWASQNSGVTKYLFSVRFISLTEGWAVGQDETILHTTDGGTTWIAAYGTVGLYYYSVFFINSTEGWIGGSNGKVLHTTDGGLNWISKNTGFSTSFASIYFTDTNHGWAVGYDAADNAIRTINGGLTWQLCDVSITCPLESVFFIDNNKGWIAGKFNWGCSDGNSFGTTSANAGTGNHMYGTQFLDASIGYCVGDTGLITKSIDGGVTWDVQYSGTLNRLNSIFVYTSGDAWVVGANGTILKNSPSSVTTSVKQNSINYGIRVSPNPFAFQTTISFTYELKDATLKIMDVLGKEVGKINFSGKELVIEKEELKSGIYFMQVISENEMIANEKIVIQ